MRLRALILLLPFALALVSMPVVAQPRDPAAAQALFDEALALMKAGRHAEACPKLTESQRLDPGVGTQFHLGDCFEKTGRIASAWALFLEVESIAKASGQKDRESVAAARAERLAPRLPRLRIVVPAGRNVPGLEVTRSGVSVGQAQWGAPIPVDPGTHEVVSKAPGRRSVSLTVEAREGETVTAEIPELGPPEPAPAGPAPERAHPGTAASSDESSGKPTELILGLGGAGVIGVGIGATFALLARSQYESSKASCRPDDPNLCNAAGVAERNRAIAKGNVATVAFAVGGAALAGAAVVFLVSGDPERPTPSTVSAGVGVLQGGASLLLRGAFE